MVFNGLGSPHLDQDCATEAAPPLTPSPPPPALSGHPRKGRAAPCGLPPTPRGLGGRSPRPHPPPPLLPGERLEAGEPGAAPLCRYLDPKRNGAFLPRREVCEPLPLRNPLGVSGRGRIPPPGACSKGGLEACSSRPVSVGPEEARGVVPGPSLPPSGIAASAHLSRSSRQQRGPAWSQPLPQSLPCFRGSRGGRAGCHPQPAGLGDRAFPARGCPLPCGVAPTALSQRVVAPRRGGGDKAGRWPCLVGLR